MTRLGIALLALVFSGLVQASGLPYRVESLTKAQALSAKDSSKHVLIFYTSEN